MHASIRRHLPILLAAAALTALLAAATTLAATKNGIKPLSPKAGSSIPAGKSPTMRARVKGKGTVWFHVCKSKKRDREGVICHDELIQQAKKRKGVYVVKPRFFDFPEFWLNNPGRYFWQAFRIQCEGDLNDCKQEGPVTRFRVR